MALRGEKIKGHPEREAFPVYSQNCETSAMPCVCNGKRSEK